MPPRYLCGLDLGQAGDYTALTVVQAQDDQYAARHIERLPLDIRYPQVVEHICAVIRRLARPIPTEVVPYAVSGAGIVYQALPPTRAQVTLLVDYTGVGRPVMDMIWAAQHDGRLDHCDVVPITITAGESVRRGDYGLNVPKRELASAVQRCLQEQRLKIAAALPHADALRDELLGFRAKISLRGHDSYGAGEDWRSGAKHDDLVLALALAIWYGEHYVEVGVW